MKESDNRIEELFKRTEEVNNIELPLGHRQRFLAKLQEQEGRPGFLGRIGLWLNNPTAGRKAAWVLSPAICIIAAVLLIRNFSSDGYLHQMELGYRQDLQKLGSQLTQDSKTLEEYNQEDALYSISSIVEDDGQLIVLQLPPNLSKKEKQQIIKEYYNQKMEGLKKIKTFIAMNNSQEE